MLIPDLGPGEPGRSVLEELGVPDQVEVMRGCRGNVFPDFASLRPDSGSGPYWRREFFKETFPEDTEGLEKEKLTDSLLGEAEKIVPGLRAHARVSLTLTPGSFER